MHQKIAQHMFKAKFKMLILLNKWKMSQIRHRPAEHKKEEKSRNKIQNPDLLQHS